MPDDGMLSFEKLTNREPYTGPWHGDPNLPNLSQVVGDIILALMVMAVILGVVIALVTM